MADDPNAVFSPTEEELAVIVRYWEEEELHVQAELIFAGMSIRDEDRAALGLQRIACVASVLGEKEVERIIEKVRADYANRLGPENWELFIAGIPG